MLRYQDAAIQILSAIQPNINYRRRTTSSYFSTEQPEDRAEIIASIKSWYEKSRGKSEEEQKWIAVEENPGIYQALNLLKSLAEDFDRKEQVLEKLRQMCKTRDPIQLPQLSYLMCQLGDSSELDKVASEYLAGGYDIWKRLPDDSAPGSNAQSYALRQMILYGSDEHHEELRKHLHLKNDRLSKGSALFSVLREFIPRGPRGQYGGPPKGYDKENFPIHLLIEMLDFRENYGQGSDGTSQWTFRKCDEAAESIQAFTGVDFGFDKRASTEEKDPAIEKIRTWWNDEGMKKYK